MNKILYTGLFCLFVIFLSAVLILSNKSPLVTPTYESLTPNAKRQVQCLTNNIYFESRSESLEGQVAVAFVTINRVNSKDFPDDICSVVTQMTGRTCQFSWYCEGTPKRQYVKNILTTNHSELYNEIKEVALFVYANHEKIKDPTYGSLYYHADYVNPRWYHLERVKMIGRHIFYKPKEA